MQFKQYQRLWRLAQARLASEEDYRIFQAYQAQLLLGYFKEHQFDIEAKLLVDLGSGIAGYSQHYARQGATVISVDLTQPRNVSQMGVQPISANALAVPLSDESVDFVVCASLIEHVAHPQGLIAEIERILKVGGGCYLSFPPFYSPAGGHEFAPYHYLGEKAALRLKSRKLMVPDWARELYQVPLEPDSFANLYPGWGLYKMTIRKARRMISESGLAQVNMSTRYMPISFVRWPILGELLTWHAQFLLVKQP